MDWSDYLQVPILDEPDTNELLGEIWVQVYLNKHATIIDIRNILDAWGFAPDSEEEEA